VLVQSSSITTSLIVPLIGAGIITLRQAFPYILGSNIGTTITAFLASFAADSPEAISIAFAHLIFNIYGISIFWPLKRIPIALAEMLARFTQRKRIVSLIYILITFFIIPGLFVFFVR
jgi:sodium-dependent phosphate cotransporter